MKKLIAVLLLVLLAVISVACKGNVKNNETTEPTNNFTTAPTERTTDTATAPSEGATNSSDTEPFTGATGMENTTGMNGSDMPGMTESGPEATGLLENLTEAGRIIPKNAKNKTGKNVSLKPR